MYVPAHFAMTAEQVRDVLASAPAGDLVTSGPDGGPEATYLPMLLDPDASGLGSLIGHLSRVNDQWRRAAGEALFIVHGPDHYIKATWLSRPGAPSVPTWNYVTVHAYGELVVHDDHDWVAAAVRRLSAAHGDAGSVPLPEARIDRMLRAVVGVELRLTRVVGKAKMSQNKAPEVIGQVIEGLRETGDGGVSDWMSAHSLPRAQAKAELLVGLRKAQQGSSIRS